MKTAMELLMGLVSMVHVVFVSGQSLSMRFARNLTPADHLSLRYERWTNSKLNVAVGGFMEQSRKNKLCAYPLNLFHTIFSDLIHDGCCYIFRA